MAGGAATLPMTSMEMVISICWQATPDSTFRSKASPAAPVSLYAQDIDNDASVEPVLCYYIQGKSYPLPSRDELLEQVPPLRKRFTSYALYADATINELVGAEKLSKSLPAKSQHV